MTLGKKTGILLKNKVMIIGLLLTTLLFSGTVHAAYTTLSVTNVAQAKSNWCWAACIEMSATSLGYSDYDQWDIVKDVKGTSSDSYPNDTGGGSDYSNGMKYATNNDWTATESMSTISISSMNTEISASRPIMMAWGYYSNGKRTGGHANVIYAVDEANKYIKLQDPNGNSYTKSYSSLTSDSAKKYDKTIKISTN